MNRILDKAANVAASQTDAPVVTFATTPAQQTSLRVDAYIGRVAGTPDLKLQDSSGLNVWNAVKSVTLSPSTNKTVSAVSTSADTLTCTGHAYPEDTVVVINSTSTTPGGVAAGTPYYVKVIDANTFQLKQSPSSNPVDITASGAGTITATQVTLASIAVQETDTADQAFTPVRRSCRLVADTGASETVQVVYVYQNS